MSVEEASKRHSANPESLYYEPPTAPAPASSFFKKRK
jgi:hypothetical protein